MKFLVIHLIEEQAVRDTFELRPFWQ